MTCGRTFRLGRTRLVDGRSSASGTLRIRSLADYTINTLGSSFRKRQEGASPPYAVRLATMSGGPISTASGVKLIADPLPRAVPIDTLLIPGGPGVHTFRKDRKALAALQRLCMRSSRICAACTGAFAL